MDRLIEAVSDIALVVESDGTISDVHLGAPFDGEEADSWLGMTWESTVTSATRPKVRELIEQARQEGVSRSRQVNHTLPSGTEVAVGYTAVRLRGSGPVLAVGRSMQVVSDLQRRLVDAQQRLERDYWRLRQVETRYRLLFKLSSDAVLMVKPGSLEVLESNQAAADALGMDLSGLVGGRLPMDRFSEGAESLERALATALERGTAPAAMVTLEEDGSQWLFKVSLVRQESGDGFLIHMHPRGGQRGISAPSGQIQLSLVENAPDGFVVTDESGVVLHANAAFCQMAEVSTLETAVGRSLGDWLGRPGADLTVLLSNLKRYGVVNLFATDIVGAMGTDAAVELSAVLVRQDGDGYCGILVRHVGRRLQDREAGPHELAAAVEEMTDMVGNVTLRTLVRQTVSLVERHFIGAALELTGDNRTAAAELLGLSRQSLYTKLRRYDVGSASDRSGG